MKVHTSFFIRSAIASLLLLSTPLGVLAETATEQVVPTNVELSQTSTVAVADINVTDVDVTEKDGTISGTFALQGKMGQQNDIAYGIVVVNKENIVLDVQRLGMDASVQLGEIKTIPLTYTFPPYLSGAVTIFVRAETSAGLPLGTQRVLEKTFASGYKKQLTCATKGDAPEFSCTNKQGGELTIAYFAGSLFGATTLEEKLVAKPGVPLLIKPVLLPGAYTTMVRDTKSGELTVLALRVPGAFGAIQNVSIAQEESAGALTGVVVARVSPSKGATIVATLLSEKNVRCGTVTVPLLGMVAEFGVTAKKCQSGTVEVALKSADGTVLDTVAQKFSVTDVRMVDGGGDVGTNSAYVLLALFVMGIVFLGVLYFLRRHKNVLPILFATTMSLSMFGLAQPAQAVTFGVGSLGYSGEIGYTVFVSVTPDRSSYYPGQTMMVTGAMNVSTDAGAGAPSSITDSSVAYNSDGGGAPVWDTPWPASGAFPVFASVPTPLSLPDNSSAGPFVGMVTFTVPLTMTLGNHYFANRLIMWASYPGNTPSAVFRQATGNMTFDVVSPPCDLGCGGFMQYRTDASSQINDFTAPAGNRLRTQNGEWSAGFCSGIFTQNPFGGTFTALPDASCVAPPTYPITSSVTNPARGSISPSGTTDVPSGGTQAFTTAVNAGSQLIWYHIDGNSYALPTNPFTFTNVLAPHSIQAVLFPFAAGAPAQPVGVQAVPQACGTITISWPPDASATAGHSVYVGTAADPFPPYTIFTPSGSELSQTSFVWDGTSWVSGVAFSFAPLIPGTRYYFSVEGSNALGEFNYSFPVSAIAPPACAATPACKVQTSVGGTENDWFPGSTDFDDYWMRFNDPNMQFTASGFAAIFRERACATSPLSCNAYGYFSAGVATIRPPVPLACASYAAQCSNGIDNADSEDTLADTNDPGCHSDGNAGNAASYVPTDNDETNVAALPWANFSATPSCIIPTNASGCSASISWDSGNITSAYLTDTTPGYYTDRPIGPQTYNTPGVWMNYGGGTFQIRDSATNGPVLTTVTGTATCGGTDTWDIPTGRCVSTGLPSVNVWFSN